MRNRRSSSRRSNLNNPTSRLPPGPLVLLLVPLCAGILLGWYRSVPPTSLLISLAGLLVLLFLCHANSLSGLFSACLWLFVFLLGAGRVQLETVPVPGSTEQIPEQTILTATGHLSNVEQKTKTTPAGGKIPWSTATLHVHRISIRGNTRPASGTLQLYTFRNPAPYSTGMRIRVEGMLNKSDPSSNPGGTSWTWYREQHEIGGTLIVQTVEDWQLRPAVERCMSGHLSALRNWIHQQMKRPQTTFDLAPALLLGMRSKVDTELEETFQRSGTVHFLAVSGLHVGFLLVGGFFLLRWLRVSPNVSTGILVFFLTVYLALTGFRLPTIRASTMIMLLLVGIQIRRNLGSLQLLGIAAWILLLLQPLDLLSPGFHFSFLSVTGLVLLSGSFGIVSTERKIAPEKRLLREFLWLERVKGYLWSAGEYALSVMGATAVVLFVVGPLIVYHFHLVSPGSLIANPLLFLLLPVLLVAGFVHMILAVLSGLGVPLISVLLPVSGLLLRGLESITIQISSAVTHLPGAYLYLPSPGFVFLVLYYMAIFAIWWFHRRLPQPRWSIWIGAVSCFTGLLVTGFLFPASPNHRPSLTMLDVGHGSNFLLTDRSNHTVVYDCGSTGYSDPGKWITAPALWRRGTSTIDLLILSHSDLDHISGIRALSYRFSIRRVWVSPSFDTNAEGRTIMKHLTGMGIPVKTVSAGYTATVGRITLNVQSPPRSTQTVSPSSRWTPNESSLVVQATTEGHSVLFTGDLEHRGKRWYQHQGNPPRKADMLQVPHHGGSGSADNPLTDVVTSRWALISATEGRVSHSLVNAYQTQGSRVMSTVEMGAVQLRWGSGSRGPVPYAWKDDQWYSIQVEQDDAQDHP